MRDAGHLFDNTGFLGVVFPTLDFFGSKPTVFFMKLVKRFNQTQSQTMEFFEHSQSRDKKTAL